MDVDFRTLVLEVDDLTVFSQCPTQRHSLVALIPMLLVKGKIVVSCYHDLDIVLLFSYPLQSFVEFRWLAVIGQITSVDENIAFGESVAFSGCCVVRV